MQYFFLCFCTLAFILMAGPAPAFDFFDAIEIEAAGIEMDAGYRSDQLDWNIAGDLDGSNPNVLSELTWEDLETFQVQANGWLELGELPFLKRNTMLLGNISFGKILGGNVQDSDYAVDDRGLEWSRSVNGADKGMTADLSGAIGPVWQPSQVAGMTVTPLIGYGFNMQALYMTDGNQQMSDPFIRLLFFGIDAELPPDEGPIAGLDSSYTSYWYGPWLGLNVDYAANDRIKLTLGFEYHWVEYFAQADWNLRSDFAHPVSFEHEAEGVGIVWSFKGRYQLNAEWAMLLRGKIQTWEAEQGTDRTYFSDGGVSVTRLNTVSWDSYALTTGLEYRF